MEFLIYSISSLVTAYNEPHFPEMFLRKGEEKNECDMSRQIKGICEEYGNETEELKFINRVNDDNFTHRFKDISIDRRITIIKNGLKSSMARRGPHSSGSRPGHVAVINLEVPDNTGNCLAS